MHPFLRPASPISIASVFAVQRAADPFGLRIHELCAIISCMMVAAPTSIAEWAMAPVLVCFLIRFTNPANSLVTRPLLRDRVAQLVFITAAFAALSFFWSACRVPASTPELLQDRRDWLKDFQSYRFALMLPLLYPVLERRAWLIAALIAGMFCGEMSQLVHILAESLHIPSLSFHRMPGRLSGWWDPVVGGSILTGGLGLVLTLAASGTSTRMRLLGILLSCLSIACILATGTRGAWIAAAGLTLFTIAFFLLRRGNNPKHKARMAAALVLALVLGSVAIWCIAGPGLRARYEQGRAEVARAIEHHDELSDTGMRIAMWRWAKIEYDAHPIVGVGAGGFRAYADQQLAQLHPTAASAPLPEGGAGGGFVDRTTLNDSPSFQNPRNPPPNPLPLGGGANLPPRPHAHAHSWYFHTLATTGIIGFALMLSAISWALHSGLKELGFQLAPALALIGLALAGLFDTIHINQQTALLLWTLVALCVPSRPALLLNSRSSPERVA